MNTTEIEQLLKKFYDGVSTEEEEQTLKEFFRNKEVPPHLAEHAGLFGFYDQASGETLNDAEFEEEFMQRITVPEKKHSDLSRINLYYLSAIAAGLLILAGLFFTFRNDLYKNREGTSTAPSNSQIAYNETREILFFVSAKFNHGMDKLHYLGEFDKAMQKMDYLSKYYQYQTLIINPETVTPVSSNTQLQ